jgi:phosphohistidine swiveling domain-containing protein
VVGTSVATLRIKTGDLLEVDGTRGVVTIVERAATSS